ncbi:amino acid ABC transporter permease [Mesorhizobium sp. BAC0120]|uniref:amino acid ABC transporter permease n=1 Tax=Mesorhizobium sp. BAC0120 TaxID=3090670 RepID=UPI00298C2988|nr:amino acid ABC transporter permease [Mesorhizobium sp. BAC0120]MDW6024017.1 amino acid ABC transporter permease [Mesorhizobium sp. BAC0120]
MSLRDFGPNELMFILLAARWTIVLALIAFIGGGVLGMVIAALRVAPVGALRWLAAVYIQFFMGTPLLIQLFMAYYGSSLLGYRPDVWTAAALTFCLNGGAFFGEIFRGAIEAIPKGQWEASTALGFRFLRTLRLVIVPQAVRLMLPPAVGFMVQIVKSTSVASLIGFTEVARASVQINTVTFEPVLVFGTASAIYFALCWPLSLLSTRLERRFAVGVARKLEQPLVMSA